MSLLVSWVGLYQEHSLRGRLRAVSWEIPRNNAWERLSVAGLAQREAELDAICKRGLR